MLLVDSAIRQYEYYPKDQERGPVYRNPQWMAVDSLWVHPPFDRFCFSSCGVTTHPPHSNKMNGVAGLVADHEQVVLDYLVKKAWLDQTQKAIVFNFNQRFSPSVDLRASGYFFCVFPSPEASWPDWTWINAGRKTLIEVKTVAFWVRSSHACYR